MMKSANSNTNRHLDIIIDMAHATYTINLSALRFDKSLMCQEAHLKFRLPMMKSAKLSTDRQLDIIADTGNKSKWPEI